MFGKYLFCQATKEQKETDSTTHEDKLFDRHSAHREVAALAFQLTC